MSADELAAANKIKGFLKQNYGISPDDVSDFSLSDLVDLSMRASIAKPMMDNFKVPESELEGLSEAYLYNLYPKVVASYFIFVKSCQAYNPEYSMTNSKVSWIRQQLTPSVCEGISYSIPVYCPLTSYARPRVRSFTFH